MNKINTTLTLLFTTLFALLSSKIGHAQVEQVTIDGQTFYVYPLQKQVRSLESFYYSFADKKEEIKRDDRNEKIVQVNVRNLTKEEIQSGISFTGKYRKYQKKIIESLSDFSEFLVETDNSMEYDPTPALTNLPDGKYVQYYRDIPYIKDRVVRYKNDVVAGYFEIKNNMLNGPSIWLDPAKKISREGNYLDGEKDGVWKYYNLDENYLKSKYDEKASIADNLKNTIYDTTVVTCGYKSGLKNGNYEVKSNGKILVRGAYTLNQETGSWEIYNFKQHIEIFKKQKVFVNSDTLVLTEKYTYRADSLFGKSIILTHGLVKRSYLYNRNDSLVLNNQFGETESYSMPSNYPTGYYDNYSSGSNFNFDLFYTVYRKTATLDLDEEEVNSYEGEEFYEEDYYEPEFNDRQNRSYNPEETYKYNGNKQYTLNDYIDSAGYLMLFEGDYERYYLNGQLQFKCKITNGQLVSYSPIYWDNGKIACEVKYLSDSNQYIQEYFDYTGKKYHQTSYDGKGNVLSRKLTYSNNVTIDGVDYYDNSYLPTYVHTDYDSLFKGTTSMLETRRELFKVNRKIALTSNFNPADRTMQHVNYNLLGDTVVNELVQFSEGYETVHSKRIEHINNLSLEYLYNGSLNTYYKENRPDSISEQAYAISWRNNFEVTSDYVVKVNNIPFTGSFKITRKTGGFSVKASDKAITIALPNPKADKKLYTKQVDAFIKKGKAGNLIPYYSSGFMGSQLISHAVATFFPNLFQVFSGSGYYPNYGFDPNMNYESINDEEYQSYDNSKSLTEIISAEGTYLDGKPNGKWLYKNRKGQVLFEMNYGNGQRNGPYQQYSYAYPAKKMSDEDYEYMLYENPEALYESYPKKITRFVTLSKAYKNGMEEGAEISYNWQGDTLSYTFYETGLKKGKSFERNKFFYSVANYENDRLDGIVRTYLTPPKRDSILLFDLNFQNGFLQGESKAYHTNGRIAKKGFFLTGQPIDDYEAYDTLGFRYQYVKFLYSQPIEEKIWEENQLSVKYEFDWRDSIGFNFTDITNATSVSTLLYNMGYDMEEMYQPYMGRPSLTNKTGINYYVTKYYPNDTVARHGSISKGKKVGCWHYYNYKGIKLMEVDYFDTIITINDSTRFKAKGILSYVDQNNNIRSKSWIIEKFEKYDCANTDHTEERMLYCFWERDTNEHRMNGYVKNYYDNGNVQNEGWVKNGLPTGIWKMYDVNGNLSSVGEYVLGKRNGRWLKGDLGSVKNMSEICLNPNLENLEEILSYQEKLLDISVIIYKRGKVLKQSFYGINMNSGDAPDGYGEEEYYEGY